MEKITLKCHKIVGGVGRGEALVAKETISITGGLDPNTGKITHTESSLFGKSIKGKVLVYIRDKGSTSGPFVLYNTYKRGNTPAAVISLTVGTITASGLLMCGIPSVDKPDRDPFEVIENGDYVTVDADKGLVEVEKKKS